MSKTKARLNIAFLWWWDRASEIMPLWRDGLRAAIEELEKDHKVSWFLDKTKPLPEDNFDIILVWCDDACEFLQELPRYSAKKGLCLTTNPHNPGNLLALDAVFCESRPVLEEVRNLGAKGVLAFGTDTEFFRPSYQKKTIKYFYPATFSPWKRQSAISHHGKKLLCVGTVQPDGVDEYNACIKDGVRVEVGYFPVEKIRDYYRQSRVVLIPAIHGSERTVLETMSMNMVPEVNPENVKARSFILEYMDSVYKNPREFVEANYSAKKYAQTILNALK
jgi:hypothetical protein